MNTKLHAVTDANGRPLSFFMTAGQVSDYIGAAALLDELPKARPSEGLAPRRHALRSMPKRLLLRHRPRSHRHLLAVINES